MDEKVKEVVKKKKEKVQEKKPEIPASSLAFIAQLRMARKRRKGLVEANRTLAIENFYRENISDNYNKPMGILMTRISEFNKYGASLRVYFSFVE
jgi:hypothetical protein